MQRCLVGIMGGTACLGGRKRQQKVSNVIRRVKMGPGKAVPTRNHLTCLPF